MPVVRPRVALAIFLLLQVGLFFFQPRLVFLVLLVFVDEVARGYDF
jgi:hypothetical protein